MALVESNYLEEQRKMRNLERSQREKDERRRRWLEHSHAVHQARFERWIAAVTTFTLPIVLVSGLFGMNNDDLPRNWPFWPVVGVTLCFSLILLVIVGCLSRRLSLRDRSEKEELNNLM
jgi:membrane protein YdbS with pleckstrin-like domain